MIVQYLYFKDNLSKPVDRAKVNTNYKENRVAIVVAGLHADRFTDGTMDHLPVDTTMGTVMVIKQVHLEEDHAGVEAEDVAVTVADARG